MGKKTKRQETQEIDIFLQKKHSWEFMDNMTIEKLERILAKPEYKIMGFWDKSSLSDEERKQIQKAESVVSFGREVANLFEDMVNRFGFIPTQQEYCEAGVELVKYWWGKEAHKEPKVRGVVFNDVVKKSVQSRLARTWVSNIVEIHTKLLIQETMPNLKIYSHDLLDLVAGVDLVAEDDNKRYYIHIFKNTEWGFRSFKVKEKRGGLFKDKQFIKYNRDFSQDVIFAYEWDTRTEHVSTKFINDIPVFRSEFIEWKFMQMAKTTAIGEDLTKPDSKLHHFESWIHENFGRQIKFQDLGE